MAGKTSRKSVKVTRKATAKRLLDVELEQLNGRAIYVALYCQEASKEAIEAGDRQIEAVSQTSGDREMAASLSFFDMWPELPSDGNGGAQPHKEAAPQ